MQKKICKCGGKFRCTTRILMASPKGCQRQTVCLLDCVTFAEFNANMERTRRVRFPYFVPLVRALHARVTYSSLIVSVFKRAPVLVLRNLLNAESSGIHALGCLFSDVVTCIHVATLLFLFTRNPLMDVRMCVCTRARASRIFTFSFLAPRKSISRGRPGERRREGVILRES